MSNSASGLNFLNQVTKLIQDDIKVIITDFIQCRVTKLGSQFSLNSVQVAPKVKAVYFRFNIVRFLMQLCD